MGQAFQSSGAMLAALAVGVFFTCTGFNKLYQEQRRMEMNFSMRRLFHSVELARIMWMFVSTCQLFFGITLAMFSPYSLARVLVLPLLTICIVAWWSIGYDEMMRQWKPVNFPDHVACWLWSADVQLTLLCVVVLLG